MDDRQLQEAFDDVFDQALTFHAFADHLRDYDLYVHAVADPVTGIAPAHLRYRFTHCVRATVTTTVAPDVWARSLDDALLDPDYLESPGGPTGYVWGVRWQVLYPGLRLRPPTDETRTWQARLGIPMREVHVGTNGHDISLVFSDLRVDELDEGATPFVVE